MLSFKKRYIEEGRYRGMMKARFEDIFEAKFKANAELKNEVKRLFDRGFDLTEILRVILSWDSKPSEDIIPAQ